MLRQAVLRYLDAPGCNVRTAKTAQERLRWAAENL